MHAIRTTPLSSPWPWIVGAAALMGTLVLSACSTPRTPEGVQPVTGFDVDRYTGQWHEVARIENSFERGLTQATATYSRSALPRAQLLEALLVAEAVVGVPGGEQLRRRRAVRLQPLTLPVGTVWPASIGTLVPVEPEPGQVTVDRRFEFGSRAGRIDVLHAQQEAAAAGRGKVMVEQRRKRMAKMQQTVRAGRKPKDTIF